MKQEGIGTPYPTQTAPANYDTFNNYEVLTAPLINGETLDIMPYATRVKEVHDAGWGSRLDG